MEDTVLQEKQVFYQKLGEITGAENVLTGEKATMPYTVDGVSPQTVVYPTSTQQVADIIKAANITYRITQSIVCTFMVAVE